MHERRADRGIDAARERAENPAFAHLRPDRFDGLVDERGRLPGATTTRDLVKKVAQNLPTLRGVDHLGMKGDAKATGGVGHGGDGRVLGLGQPAEARWGLDHVVPMAHPHRQVRGQIEKESGRVRDLDARRAILPLAGRRDLTAKLIRQQLHAVADAQHRHACVEGSRIATGSALLVNTGRAAGEDQGAWGPIADRVPRRRPGDQLAVNAGFPDAARDQLAVLRTEVQDQHQFLGPGGTRDRVWLEGRRSGDR